MKQKYATIPKLTDFSMITGSLPLSMAICKNYIDPTEGKWPDKTKTTNTNRISTRIFSTVTSRHSYDQEPRNTMGSSWSMAGGLRT